jgi:hypothetical protein
MKQLRDELQAASKIPAAAKMGESIAKSLQGAFSKSLNFFKNKWKEIQKDMERTKAIGSAIFDETRTPMEKFIIEMKALTQFFQEGGLNAFGGEDTLRRKQQILIDQLANRTSKDKKPIMRAEFQRVDLRNMSLDIIGAGAGNTPDEQQVKEQKKGNELQKKANKTLEKIASKQMEQPTAKAV